MSARIAAATLSLFVLASCAAYRAQHDYSDASAAPDAVAAAAKAAAASAAPAPAPAPKAAVVADRKMTEAFEAQPLDMKQAVLISEIDRYREELKQNGQYDCCVKPACRQCAMTAGECHCRHVIEKNGPCCGECTQAWVEGRGDAEGVDREKVLEHLGCLRELYDKKVPDGVTPPGQAAPAAKKDGQ